MTGPGDQPAAYISDTYPPTFVIPNANHDATAVAALAT
jgi:hypothetical protein